MSITKDRGQFVVECDHCHETYEADDTKEEFALFQQEGWYNRKHRGEWKHFCQISCMEAYQHEHKILGWTHS